MLMRLKRLCSRLEMTILPPPGGPIPANRNMSYKHQNRKTLTSLYFLETYKRGVGVGVFNVRPSIRSSCRIY